MHSALPQILSCLFTFIISWRHFRELEIARRKKRWRIKEAQLRAERSRGAEMKGNNGTCDVTDGESSQQLTSSNCQGAGIAIPSADEVSIEPKLANFT